MDSIQDSPTFALPAWLSAVTGAAGNGVQLFFVISAFTLTLSAARNPGDSLAHYALRRIARVGPAYWLAGIGYTVLGGLGPHSQAPNGIGIADLLIAAIFGSSWQGGAALAVVPGGWSVSCEVTFYLALPLLLLVIDGRVWRAALLTAGSIVLAAAAYRVTLPIMGPFAAFVTPVEQAPVFLCGITAAILAARRSFRNVPGATVLLLAIAIVAIPLTPINHMVFLQFTAVAALLVILNARCPARFLASRPMREIGTVSYSMYLIHFVVLAPSLMFAEWLLPADTVATMVLHYATTCLVTFILARGTYAVIERPFIRWAASHTQSVAHAGLVTK